jgi:hypothetical protein
VYSPISKNTNHKKEKLKKSTKDIKRNATLATHLIVKGPHNMLFDYKGRTFNSIKDPHAPFIPQSPHDAKRHGLPHLSYFVAMKTSLPTFQKINHRFGHHPNKAKTNKEME